MRHFGLWLGVVAWFVTAPAWAAEAHVWEVWEKAFEAADKIAPDAELSVEFVSPAGKKHTVAGFWDGDSTWRVRFRPNEAGSWGYRSRSKPAVKGLDAVSGRFDCGKARGTTALTKHGPVRVVPGKTYLEHVDGTPFFWLGDTVWNGPLLATRDDWNTFLDDRQKKCFSVIQYNALAPWRTAPADEKGQVAFTGRKDVQINPAFFRRLDERIRAINEHGLVAAPVLAWALRADDPGNILPEEDVLRLVRYQVARYGAFHVAWILAGDNPYSKTTTERWKRIGRAVFGDGVETPTMTHPTGMNWPWESWDDEKWLNVLGYQSGHGDDGKTLTWLHSGPPAQHALRKPTRPILNLEPPYEDHNGYQSRKPHSAYNVRRAVWWSLLNTPPAGFTYGGHGIWSWQTKPGEEPRAHKGSGVAKVWSEAKDLPGAAQMKHVAEFVASIPWWQLRPLRDFLVEPKGLVDPFAFVGASRTEKGDLALAYLPKGGTLTLAKGWPRSGMTAQWFDPRTGKRTAARDKDGSFEAPDGQDWLLIIEASN